MDKYGVEMGHSINAGDVYMRTDLGFEEVATKNEGVLPHEARTLLIVIDGRKSYGQIAAPLENRKIFRDTGGVRQYLQLLIDLEYIQLKNRGFNKRRDDAPEPVQTIHEITLVDKASEQVIDLREEKRSRLKKTAADKLEATPVNDSTEKLRSIIALLIDKHAKPDDSWMYRNRLKECADVRSIFNLVQEIQRHATGQFEVALYMTALAFKKSKVG